jgi:LmbE family N-acetylglucosaminyl deacetylase
MSGLSRSACAQALLRRRTTIAIIAPHPDDELFGCGLLIAAARRVGVKLVVIVLTDGQASHPGSARWPPARLGRLRRQETRRGMARLGARDVPLRFMGWGDGRLAEEGCARRLRRLLHEHGAGIALVSSPRDFHADHRTAFALAERATARSSIALGTYEVWSRVDVRVAPTRSIDEWRKRWAARAHRSQLGKLITDDPGGFAFEAHAFAALTSASESYAWRSQAGAKRASAVQWKAPERRQVDILASAKMAIAPSRAIR